MTIKKHPPQASIVTVNFDLGFKPPEMIKKRPCIVLSNPKNFSAGLCIIVPLSTTPPNPVRDFHMKIDVPFEMPAYWQTNKEMWVKGDMIYTVGFHRVDLLSLGKDLSGKRKYQYETLSPEIFQQVQNCLKNSLSL